MKKTRFLQFLSAFLLTVIMTSEVNAQLASRGDTVSATNINLAVGDSNIHGFVLETLVSEQQMREALRQKVSEVYEHLQEVGQTQAALQLFSVVGGVLAGYEHEAPDVVAVLADVPAEGVDVPMLQQSLSALCNAKNRQGELLWIDLKVCTYAALKPVKKNPLLARLVLFPGRPWDGWMPKI
ncbi:MAG: hypothetical protein EOL87_12855 [Spartobacteria bacterium]|nr:hypothetical protein [Spartobacteria bacterium]